MQRLALISDTHLSARHGFFYRNVVHAIEAINAAAPDFVIHSGDITINGAEDEADLRFAAFVHERLHAPVLFTPGNHDVGEEPGAEHVGQAIDAERVARYRRVFGETWWAHTIGEWRILSINSMLFGSGLGAEAVQWDWLLGELRRARSSPVGLITHKPLWLEHPDEAPAPAWTLAPASRDRARDLLARANLRFVASGHLHQGRVCMSEGALHVWTPSCAFAASHSLGGSPELGFAMLSLHDNGAVDAELVHPPGLTRYELAALKCGGARFLKDCPPQPAPIEWPSLASLGS